MTCYKLAFKTSITKYKILIANSEQKSLPILV